MNRKVVEAARMGKVLLAVVMLSSGVGSCSSAGKSPVGGDSLTGDQVGEDTGLGDVGSQDSLGDGSLEDVVAPDSQADSMPPDFAADKVEPETSPEVQLDLGEDVQYPQGCCGSDGLCPEGSQCAPTPYAEFPGVCVEKVKPGECYSDADCGDFQICIDPAACPCDALCEMAGPGHCEDVITGCCSTDADCDVGDICVGQIPGGDSGSCVPKPTGMECFDAGDCPDNFFCFDPMECGCTVDCMSEPGECYPLPGDCCFLDTECAEGYVCAESLMGGAPGVCEPSPLPGKCWNDEDCGEYEGCDGASTCPCNADCDAPDEMGTCNPLIGGCCDVDSECDPGFDCVGSGMGMGGTCQPETEPGKCWDEDDCYETQECLGATFCPCGAVCGVGTFPGTCSPVPVGCCYKDSDCNAGFICKGMWPGDNMPGSCVPDLTAPQCNDANLPCCYDESDCPDNSACNGGFACGCIALCYNCGACMPDQIGFCGNI